MAKPPLPLVKLNSLATVKQEPLQSLLSQPPPEPIPLPLEVVKTEPEPEQPGQPEQHQPPPQPHQGQLQQKRQRQQEEDEEEGQPQFLKAINDLASLSSAIHAFKCRFDELTKHLDFISQAIDSKFNEPQQEEERTQIEAQPPIRSTETESETIKTGSAMASPPKSSLSEIQSLCEGMRGKGLRKYIVTHLSDVRKLREEVPAALKLAPEPAKLVLDCIGKFFLQGRKAYTKESPLITARQASVLTLEFFLLMMGGLRGEGGAKISADLKVEAEKGAVAWRKRMISEGGVAKASEVDARGLFLFVACFGIPNAFKSEDLGNLLRLCNLRGISDAVKGSSVLPGKMPDIIQSMAKNGMYVEAVDIASIFGLGDKFSPKTILISFLQESTKAFKRAKQEANNSPVALRKANEKQLDALKSIVQYLKDRTSDVTKLLGSWQIEEKIVKLEGEIAELDKKIEEKHMKPKRKLDEMGSSSRDKSQEMKRSRFAAKGSPLPKSSLVTGLHEQQTAILAEGVRLYDGLVPNSYNSAISGHANNYPTASAVPHGSTVGPFPENGIGQMGGITGVGSSIVTSVGFNSASSYSRARGEIEVDRAGQMMSSSGLPYGWRGSVAQSSSMRFGSLFGSSPSIEGFIGLPDTNDRTAADLYRFADSIR